MCFDVLVDEDHGGLQKTPGGHQRGPPSAGSPSAIGTSVLMWRAAGRGLGPRPDRPRAQIPVASSDLAGRLTVAPWNGSESDRICGSQEKAQIDPSGRVWNPGRTAGSCCGPQRASRARSGPRCALCTVHRRLPACAPPVGGRSLPAGSGRASQAGVCACLTSRADHIQLPGVRSAAGRRGAGTAAAASRSSLSGRRRWPAHHVRIVAVAARSLPRTRCRSIAWVRRLANRTPRQVQVLT